MNYPINLNNIISENLIKDTIKQLDSYFSRKMEDSKLEFTILKARNLTNNFINKKTLNEFLNYLVQTDSDVKHLKKDIQNYNKSLEEDLQKDLTDLGYFLSNEVEKSFEGREEELDFIQISLKRTIKNNLIIVGDPGVGKTSLVKKLSSLIPEKIFVLELNRVLSDTKYRGAFEEKLTKLLDVARTSNFIVFIDEIHILLSGGKAEGGFSGSDLIKPYLTDPRIIIIGATTTEEYKIIQQDKALERRFNIVILNEVTKEVLQNIFRKLIHQMEIKSLQQADFEYVFEELNCIEHRNYPDKLIDFIDLYGAVEQFYGFATIDEVLVRAFYNDKENQWT